MITLSHAHGRSYAVFGLARSGIATALALAAGGARVVCWDDGAASRDAATGAGLHLVDLAAADWSRFDSLVLAPGVPLTHPVPHWTVPRAQAAGVEIIGDIELFFRERAHVAPDADVVAITGTNGKSTTTALVAHILKTCGRDVQMGGNIGVGVLALEAPKPGRIHVLELSSFQIDLTPSLAPSIGVLLNITPDHLDRHGTLERYAAIKSRVPQHSSRAVVGVYDGLRRGLCDDQYHLLAGDPGRTVTAFSEVPAQAKGIVFATDHVLQRGLKRGGPDASPDIERLADLTTVRSLRGAHNAANAAAAYLVCESLGLARDAIAAAMQTFPGLPHRLEELGSIGQVLILNDSKATNADSTEKALASFPSDIFWIAGGVAKDGGITGLTTYFPRITKAFLIGKAAPDFSATLAGHVPYETCGTLEAAFHAALAAAATSPAHEPVILLSPACASYDQYKSFEHRGDHLRQLALAHPGFRPLTARATEAV